jgi:hypothetical protein
VERQEFLSYFCSFLEFRELKKKKDPSSKVVDDYFGRYRDWHTGGPIGDVKLDSQLGRSSVHRCGLTGCVAYPDSC